MTFIPFSSLELMPQNRFRRRVKTYPVYAIDTETEDGLIKVIADNEVGREVQDFEDVVGFLTQKKLRGAIVFFYNLAFDFNVMFKLNRRVITELARTGKSEWRGYKFKTIMGKFLCVSHGKHTCRFYDLAQYFHMSLLEAHKKYIGGVDYGEYEGLKVARGSLFREYDASDIVKYCIQDALHTKELGEFLYSGFKEIGFYPRSFISEGNLSAQYCIMNANIPLLNTLPRDILKASYESYRGGWFELYRRGIVKNLYVYDIVSAYPKIIRDLPDIRDGEFLNRYDDTYEWGIVKARLSGGNKYLNPLGVRANNILFYPYLDIDITTYMTFRQYKAYERHYDIDILEAYAFVPDPHVRKPYRGVIDSMFEIKKAAPKDSAKREVSKKIMNSCYGKMFEKYCEGGQWKTGNFFNPFYATQVTGYTQAQIYEALNGDFKSVVHIATDGIFTTSPINLDVGSGLGQWEQKHLAQEGVFIKSGVYQVRGHETRLRGYGSHVSLFDILESDDKRGSISMKHVVKIKESLRRHIFNDVGKFFDVSKEINVSPDVKRIWVQNPDRLRDYLLHEYNSNPIPMSFLSRFV